MAEYIERGELEKVLINFYDRLAGCRPDFYAGFSAALKVIDEETTNADVVPVRHGRWDDSGRYRFPGGSIAVRCSECGCALTVSEYKLNKWNYCPVCGAKMDGE